MACFLLIILASQTFYPNWPIFLHGYIRHIRDIFQLWVIVQGNDNYDSDDDGDGDKQISQISEANILQTNFHQKSNQRLALQVVEAIVPPGSESSELL